LASAEPPNVADTRAAIVKLLTELQPPPTAEWISERTDVIMRQFEAGSPHPADIPPRPTT
jgi:hypothetical protein